jgi:hypothetical protein
MNELLEKKIKEHAETVFGSEPEAGHRDRFAGKLAAHRKSRRLAAVVRHAALVAAAAAVAAVFLIKTPGEPDEDSFVDTQNYYSMLLEDEIESTRQLLDGLDNSSRDEIMKDIESIQAETYPFSETGEQNEALLVNIYSSKIESLQHIQSILSENFNHSKTKKL